MIKIISMSASWCQPCKSLKPILKTVLSSHPEIEFKEVDIDSGEDEELIIQYKVKSVPTLVILKDNIEVSTTSGFRTEKELSNLIKECANIDINRLGQGITHPIST